MKKFGIFAVACLFFTACSQNGNSFWQAGSNRQEYYPGAHNPYPMRPYAKGKHHWEGPGFYRGTSWFECEEEFKEWREENRARTKAHFQEMRQIESE